MSAQSNSLTLALLHRIDCKLDQIASDVVEIQQRFALLEGQGASISRRMDRIEGRLSRIERRLEVPA